MGILNNTTVNVNYTPFNKKSFTFSDELLGVSSLPNSTDLVEVEIYDVSFPSVSLTDAHISTPVVGSAISTYNKGRERWFVKGERDDVNAVLNQVVFYPPPNTNYLNWNVSPTPIQVNQSTQPTQAPPSIPDIEWYTSVKKVSDGTYPKEGWINFQAQSDFVYYHPYMSTLPSNENVTEGTITRLDLGTIGTANMTDRNITITCEAYTSFTGGITWSNSTNDITFYDDDLYIGDKKSETPQGVEKFRFTGSVAECQSYLNSIECVKSTGSPNIYLKISLLDGLTTNQYSKTVS